MINPMYENILIDPMTEDEMTKGGIFIPETSLKTPYMKGTVLKVGHGWHGVTGDIIPLQVKPGDVVLFRKGVAIELKDDDGTKYLILPEKDILGVV